MLRALLVDDELPACTTLKWLIEEHVPDVLVVGFAHTAEEARIKLNAEEIDVVFLDISMQGENGFDLLESLDDVHVHVIFVTAHDEYAIKAFKTEAVDYLLKPVDVDELKHAVQKVQSRINQQWPVAPQAEVLKQLKSALHKDRITIPHLDGLRVIALADIVYMEADSNYTIFHLQNAQKFVSSKTMGEFEPGLSEQFFRIHKSFIINLEQVAEYSKKEGNNVIMKEGSMLPIARRRLQEFMHVLSGN